MFRILLGNGMPPGSSCPESLTMMGAAAAAAVLIFCLFSSVSARSLESVPDEASLDLREPEGQESGPVLGACWQRFTEQDRCSGFLQHNVTKADCCQAQAHAVASHRLHFGWTSYSIETDLDYFHYIVVGKPATGCQPCATDCDRVNCGSNKICRVVHGRPQCICDPDCARFAGLHAGPVCGFDGKTYRSQCSLIRSTCRRQQFIPIDYVGPCRYSCDDVQCEVGKMCMTDQNGLPHCAQCMVDCLNDTAASEQVCGGDGTTYLSMCHLERQTCLNGRSIKLAYRGPCQAGLTCAGLSCGTDRCLMDESTSTPICAACDRPCSPSRLGRSTICGTDNLTYSNYCELVHASCSQGIVIDTKHYGPCRWRPVVGLDSDAEQEVVVEDD